MAMTIMNNPSAMLTLGELNKNVSKLGKQLKKVSSGMRINNAGDDASGYAISEKMRARIRGLDQDTQNVQNGKSLLRVAEGGIQNIIEEIRTLKELALNAANDTNTDLDRATIQKEFENRMANINDIATETNYNGKLLLVGSKEIERVTTWEQLPEPRLVEDSDLHLIADVYDVLDGIEGPFDTLPFFDEIAATAEPLLGNVSSVNMAGGTPKTYDAPLQATQATFTIDFSNYANGAAADGVGFYTSTNGGTSGVTYYVLTTDTSKNYKHDGNENVREIDVSGCTTPAEIANTVASVLQSKYPIDTATASGSTISITTSDFGSVANNTTIAGWSEIAETAQKIDQPGKPPTYGRTGATHTELSNFQNPSKSISVTGDSASGHWTTGKSHDVKHGGYVDSNTDEWVPETYETVWDELPIYVSDSEGTTAKLSLNLTTVDEGSGFRIQSSGGTAYVKFVRGNGTAEADPRDNSGVYIIDLNAEYDSQNLYVWDNLNNDTTKSTNVRFSYSSGVLRLESVYQGDTITVTDGFDSSSDGAIAPTAEVPPTYKDVEFAAVTAYPGPVSATTGGQDRGAGHEGNRASYTIDLSAYDTTDGDALESFIDELKGKNLNVESYSWEFIDTKVDTSFDAMQHSSASRFVDLNELRSAVSGGTTVADAFIDMMLNKNISASVYNGIECFEDASNGSTKALKINAYNTSDAGNNDISVSLLWIIPHACGKMERR